MPLDTNETQVNVPAMTMPSPLCDNLRLPVIGSPLFIISGPELVIAQCKAGVIGSFPALNARPQAQLDEWLHQITEELAEYNRANPTSPPHPLRSTRSSTSRTTGSKPT